MRPSLPLTGVNLLATQPGQPLGITTDGLRANTTVNAISFPGADIGAQANSAIASIGCGTVHIPKGTYNFSTTINKPLCIDLEGEGGGLGAAAYATFLNYTPVSGVALADAGLYGSQKGSIRNLVISTSTASSTATGVYVGCNPNTTICTPGSGIQISANESYDNVTILGFYNGITFGANAYLFSCDRCLIQNTSHAAIAVDANTVNANSGENIRFTNSGISDNALYVLYEPAGTALPNWSFKFSTTSFDYNGNGTTAPIHGGFVGSQNHFEQTDGPIFDIPNGGSISDFGSVFILTGSSGTDACFGTVGATSTFDASYFYSVHTVTSRFCGTSAPSFLNLTGNNYGPSSYVPNQATAGYVTVTANGKAFTLFTLPLGIGQYRIYTWLNGYSDMANYGADATVLTGMVTNRLITYNPSQLTLTMSGNAVQVTLVSGATAAVQYSYVRLQ